jgi:hypothetical protein
MMGKRRKGTVMHTRGASARAGRPARTGKGSRLAVAALVALIAGCSHAGAPQAQGSSGTHATIIQCGQAKTAADVPVDVEVIRGHAACGSALTVERAYATAIRSGRAPGNGGGGPVRVKGWTCQGFATPVVLSTGNVSKCVEAGNEILAILPPASSSPSSEP